MLQVAARAGQACQVELLLVYGADPGAVDKSGRTAAEYAKQAGHGGLAGRIDASQFELSDRLSFYLTGRRPDHAAGHHFLVPEFAETSDRDEFSLIGKLWPLQETKATFFIHILSETLAINMSY